MENRPMIYKAISSAMAEIGAVSKGQRNAQQGFNYRGIDDVMNALYPVLTKNGIFLVPEVLDQTREVHESAKGAKLHYSLLKMRYTLYAEDGSSVSATVIGEGMDSGDKASNKAMATAMKYAMFQTFCIPTEEMRMTDPDMEDNAIVCEGCGKAVEPVIAKDGSTWTDARLASYTLKESGKTLCYKCFKGRKK